MTYISSSLVGIHDSARRWPILIANTAGIPPGTSLMKLDPLSTHIDEIVASPRNWTDPFCLNPPTQERSRMSPTSPSPQALPCSPTRPPTGRHRAMPVSRASSPATREPETTTGELFKAGKLPAKAGAIEGRLKRFVVVVFTQRTDLFMPRVRSHACLRRFAFSASSACRRWRLTLRSDQAAQAGAVRDDSMRKYRCFSGSE